MSECVRVIVWDFCGVLISWNPYDLFSQLIEDDEKAQWWTDNVYSYDWDNMWEVGVPFSDIRKTWISKIEQEMPNVKVEYPKYKELIDAYCELAQEVYSEQYVDNVMIRDGLAKNGFIIGGLTNMSDENYSKVSQNFGGAMAEDKFDFIILSSEVGVRKPDEKIFNNLIGRVRDEYGFDKSQILFIDDSEKNTKAAQALGMQALCYQEGADLREPLLEGFGIDVTDIANAEVYKQKDYLLGKLKPIM